MKNVNLCHDFRYGKIMYNQLDMYVGKSLKLYGEYSQGEAELFDVLISPGDCVVEVGANIGSHSVHLAQLVGENGVLWAFEPQRLVFQLLAGNIAINGLTNVHTEQKCVSDKPGRVMVPVLDATKVHNWGGVSLVNSTEGEPVEVITLDSLELPRCDFIKIDVEGMELNVLKGASALIDRCQPIIYTEADRDENNPALFAYLRSKGYHIYWHKPLLYNPDNYFGNPEDHLMVNNVKIASFNVICIPEGSGFMPEGVEEAFA